MPPPSPPPLVLPECVPPLLLVCVRVCVYTWGCMGRWVGREVGRRAGGCVWCSCQTSVGQPAAHARHTWDKKNEVSKPGQEDSRPAGRRGRIPTHHMRCNPLRVHHLSALGQQYPRCSLRWIPWLLARDIPAPCSLLCLTCTCSFLGWMCNMPSFAVNLGTRGMFRI